MPPTKRLFKVAMLDLSPEFIGHLGMSGDPRLPIVFWDNSTVPVKEEDSIIDVENTVLDLRVGEWQSLVDLPLNESRSSQRSGLGSGIPSLVGAFGLKVSLE
ncbi:hypothetical protein Tco_1341115 [Tanacetum coccineum]